MKYVFVNDLYYLIKYKYKLILKYFLVLFLYFLMTKNSNSDTYIIDIIFATTIDLKENILNIYYTALVLLNYIFVIYLSLDILKKDLDNLDNLYLRISTTKWITTKIFAVFLIVFIINTVLFLVIYSFKSVGLLYYIIILKKILFSIIISMNVYVLSLLFNKFKILWFIFLLPLIFICAKKIIISEISFLILFSFILTMCLIIFVISKFAKFSDLKE